MGMLGAVVDVEVVDEFASETVFGEHAFHNAKEQGVLACLDVLVERFLHQTFGSELTLTAGISGEVEVDAVGPFFAGELHFVGVDDDYIVATFHVGGI